MTWWLVATTVGVFLVIGASGLWKPDLPPVRLNGAGPGASTGEREARARIARIVEEVSAKDIADTAAGQALVLRVLHEVASAFHPDEDAPSLKVTLPELLLVTSRTALDLRRRLIADFPIIRDVRFDILRLGGDLMPLADQAMTGYRVARFCWNPLNGLVQEALRLGTNLAGRGMASHAWRRGAQIVVVEVGETAIMLYSGAARMDERELQAASARDAEPGEAEAPTIAQGPLRAAVVGQVNAGKSSLINALSGRALTLAEITVHTARALDFSLDHPVGGRLVVTDTIGFPTDGAPDVSSFVDVDLLFWPVAVHRADRGTDMRMLAALREWARSNPRRAVPPIIFVATHLDRLDPPGEWSPPYDLAGGQRPKELSIGAALAAAKADLNWPEARWVPAVLGAGGWWNVEAVWEAVAAVRRDADAARAMRLLEGRTTTALMSDALQSLQGAGRILITEATDSLPGAARRLFGQRDQP
ncbi:MAG: GTPase family protein [Rhodospirillales bacterium]